MYLLFVCLLDILMIIFKLHMQVSLIYCWLRVMWSCMLFSSLGSLMGHFMGLWWKISDVLGSLLNGYNCYVCCVTLTCQRISSVCVCVWPFDLNPQVLVFIQQCQLPVWCSFIVTLNPLFWHLSCASDKKTKLITHCNCSKRTLGCHTAVPLINYPKALSESH